jgi:GH25 family lysozyme M1 (1,4-beta-N-acetylmuramidase)
MSSFYLNNYVDDDIKSRYSVWVAHYGVSEPEYSGPYGMWQKSSTGSVSGITGNVDLDECYVDYPR